MSLRCSRGTGGLSSIRSSGAYLTYPGLSRIPTMATMSKCMHIAHGDFPCECVDKDEVAKTNG